MDNFTTDGIVENVALLSGKYIT